MKVVITVEGDKNLVKRVRDLQGRFANLQPYWKSVARKFFEIERRLFATEGGSGASGRWKPLSAKSRESKAREGFGSRPILQRTGRLMRSLTRDGAPDQIYRETANTLTIDTSVPYAGFHKRGTSRMPARPPIDITEGQKRELLKPLTRDLAQFSRGLGFSVTEG